MPGLLFGKGVLICAHRFKMSRALLSRAHTASQCRLVKATTTGPGVVSFFDTQHASSPSFSMHGARRLEAAEAVSREALPSLCLSSMPYTVWALGL